MYLIQLLLPLHDNDGESFPKYLFDSVREELTETFGGVTAFVRSPAVGLWKEDGEKTVRDEVIMYEVMAEQINAAWWKTYREKLCQLFKQEEMIVRATQVRLL